MTMIGALGSIGEHIGAHRGASRSTVQPYLVITGHTPPMHGYAPFRARHVQAIKGRGGAPAAQTPAALGRPPRSAACRPAPAQGDKGGSG